jgi:hypothetical protein
LGRRAALALASLPDPALRGFRPVTRRFDQISFSPFMLAWPLLPTMMWSCTEMPSGVAMSTIAGHLDIGLRRGRIAGGVIVHEPTIPSNALISLNS